MSAFKMGCVGLDLFEVELWQIQDQEFLIFYLEKLLKVRISQPLLNRFALFFVSHEQPNLVEMHYQIASSFSFNELKVCD